MRITVNVPESLGKSVKTVAQNEKKSISSLTVDALLFYFREKKKKKVGYELLEILKKAHVSKDVYKLLDDSRANDDRS